jgi:hypothetical protein
MRNLIYSAKYFVVPINSSPLTVQLYSSVITIHVKTEFDCNMFHVTAMHRAISRYAVSIRRIVQKFRRSIKSRSNLEADLSQAQ